MDWLNRLENIQNKIKLQLHSKKIDDLESLYRLIAQFDRDNSGRLSKEEFEKLLSKLGVFLTTQELRAVYDTYDSNKDGHISYADFIQFIRTTISEKRLAVVKHAFNFLDTKGSDRLEICELLRLYRAESHPRVRTSHKTAQEVRKEFSNAITKKSKDGVSISASEFLEYYADVNATLPKEKEDYFVDILLSTWGITSSVNYVSAERLAYLKSTLYEKIRQKTFTKQDEGKTVHRACKFFDLEENGVLNLSQFKATLDKFGCVFTEKEVQALFNAFDTNHSGRVFYDEFCAIFALMGSGNNPNVNPTFALTRQVPNPIITLLNTDLKKQGVFAFRRLSHICKQADVSQSGVFSLKEFQWVIQEVGFSLTKTEFDTIFKYFDKTHDGQVQYSVFIDLARGPQSEAASSAIETLFKGISGGQDKVALEWILSAYNPNAISLIAPSKKSPQDLLREFTAQWGVSNVHMIDLDMFVEFFTDMRAACPSEIVFHKYLNLAFGSN